MTNVFDCDVVVVGAGVIGAAVAHALKGLGSVQVLESEPWPGSVTTSRNSGVVHAAIYYKSGSYKETWCFRGNRLIWDFAQKHAIPFRGTGKLILAQNDEEEAVLRKLKERVPFAKLEFSKDIPNRIKAQSALYSPFSAIIDPHELTTTLLEQSEAEIIYHQEVSDIKLLEEGVAFSIGPDQFTARRLINCAGLNSAKLAGSRHFWAKGSYFQIHGFDFDESCPLIYPTKPPQGPSLGVHLTQNTAGEWYLGPNIEYIDEINYGVDPELKADFLGRAKKFIPELEEEHLMPGYAGVRPKLHPKDWSDFKPIVLGETKQLIHLLGMESPGLTSSMAVGEWVANTWFPDGAKP